MHWVGNSAPWVGRRQAGFQGHLVSWTGHCVLTGMHSVGNSAPWVGRRQAGVHGHFVRTTGHWVLALGHSVFLVARTVTPAHAGHVVCRRGHSVICIRPTVGSTWMQGEGQRVFCGGHVVGARGHCVRFAGHCVRTVQRGQLVLTCGHCVLILGYFVGSLHGEGHLVRITGQRLAWAGHSVFFGAIVGRG